jgi:hypothetical protein
MNYINTDAVVRCNCPVATAVAFPMPNSVVHTSGCSSAPVRFFASVIVSPSFKMVFVLLNLFQDPKGHIFCHFYNSTISRHHR